MKKKKSENSRIEETEPADSVPAEEVRSADGEEIPATAVEKTDQKAESDALDRAGESDELDTTDGIEFAARYSSAKERDMEKLSQEMEERSSNKTKKQKWKTVVKTILMILLIGLSIGLMFGLGDYIHGDQLGFLDMLKTSFDWRYFLILLAAIAAYILFESLKYAYLLKISTGKWRLKNSVKTMFLGKYYDGITPLGTGGQPFQIYYLHKRQIPAGVATAVPLVKYIVSTFVFGIICAVMLGLTPSYFQSDTAVSNKLTLSFMIIAWIALAFNMLTPAVMILLSAFPKVGKKIIVWIVKVLHKMRIVKHKYPVTKKYVYEVAEYRNALKLLVKKWYMLIPLVLFSVAESFIYLSFPFFTVTAIAGVEPSLSLLIQIWCLSTVSFYSASLVPTPGNSGASETTSSFIFATVAGIESVVGWVVFTWRFITFYLFIVIGVCMSIFSMIRDAVRAKQDRTNQNPDQE